MTESTASKTNTVLLGFVMFLLTILVAGAGTVAKMVVDQGQSLAGITSLLQEHTAYFQEARRFEDTTITLGQRMDNADSRADRIEHHLDATDGRVEALERTTLPRRSSPE